tara:strand:- start:146 stop:334 length:189 start_codon:yes stop_codon:yes gene_type:complete
VGVNRILTESLAPSPSREREDGVAVRVRGLLAIVGPGLGSAEPGSVRKDLSPHPEVPALAGL